MSGIRLMILSGLMFASQVLAHSGHTVWGAWRFDWEVKDNAGIAIRNVYFNNELVIWKISNLSSLVLEPRWVYPSEMLEQGTAP